MNSYQKASVISFILTICACTDLYGQVHEKSPFARQFKNCDEAFEAAKEHVTKDSILFFKEKVRFDWHDQSVDLNDFVKTQINRADQLDSVMLTMYNITVARPGGIPSYDYTQNCYNRYVIQHMDTVYAELFVIEAYNIVAKLNAEPPFDPTWVKKLNTTEKK